VSVVQEPGQSNVQASTAITIPHLGERIIVTTSKLIHHHVVASNKARITDTLHKYLNFQSIQAVFGDDVLPRVKRHVSSTSGRGYGQDHSVSVVREPGSLSIQCAGEHRYHNTILGHQS